MNKFYLSTTKKNLTTPYLRTSFLSMINDLDFNNKVYEKI